ncbi:splicing factor 3B subunit 4 [Strigomonas culicis]|uniref:Splicing factor 3B subunit 4 n=1 Tax=Strigomonas culicis TaxID=28005 RepID=S9V5A7_9TRYP|nr:splicing factor 3B subunit 4 [Strigomonas culicis]|eukprot:EPY22081.1 splicing factor 3B subunit 4 [Strigomonas culicis]
MTSYKREDLRRVVLSDLSEQCNEVIIHELCTQFGPVNAIVWPSVLTATGESQRQSSCFVDYLSSEDAKYCYEALQHTSVKLFGRIVRVAHASSELALREAGVKAPRITVSLHEIGAKVLVRNVDRTATEFDLTQFFEQFGPFAVPPRMKRDKLGNFRGTVILSYKDFASSDKLVEEMNGKVFRDRELEVQYAEMEDGSGRLHGSEEERRNAGLIQAEEQRYKEHLSQQVEEAQRQQRTARAQNTSWAQPGSQHTARRS